MFEDGLKKCTCKKKKCERYGKCEECIAYHKENVNRGLPYCKRKGNKEVDKAFKKKH